MASNAVCIYSSPYVCGSMEFETRKVQKLGYSSLGVSLPKDWAASNGIRPGALLSLAIEDDGSLRVRVGPLEEYPVAAEATIDADEWSGSESLTRMITGNYIVGCNTIRLRSREELSPSQLQEIHEAVRGLTGLTIVNQGPKFVTIENFVEPTRFPIDGLLRRLHYLTSRMEKLALGVISGDAKGKLEEVIELTMTAFFANDLGKANTALDRQAALIRDIRAAAESGPRSRSPQARSPPRSNGLFQIVLRPLEHVAKYYGSIAQITINRALERPVRPRPAGR